MTITTENLTEEDVAIVRNTYKKHVKGSLIFGIFMLVLSSGVFFLTGFEISNFEIRDLLIVLLTLLVFYCAFLSDRRSKIIDANYTKEVVTGSFVDDRSGRGHRILKIIVDGKDIYYNYQWAINMAGKKCGSFAGFIKGEDITVECFKLGSHQMMLRAYDVNKKGEKVIAEKPDQSLLKQAIAKKERTLAKLNSLAGSLFFVSLGFGYILYAEGELDYLHDTSKLYDVALYGFGALAIVLIVNVIYKKQINEKRRLLDDYNPLDNITR